MIRTANQVLGAGTHTLDVDASELANGTYFVKLEAGGKSQYRKLVVR